jgi:hypothetical protein
MVNGAYQLLYMQPFIDESYVIPQIAMMEKLEALLRLEDMQKMAMFISLGHQSTGSRVLLIECWKADYWQGKRSTYETVFDLGNLTKSESLKKSYPSSGTTAFS